MVQKKRDKDIETEFIAVVDELKAIQKLRRKKRSSKSKLDKHRTSIENLCKANASLMQIVIYLQREKRCKVARSTLHRWLTANDLSTAHPSPAHSRKKGKQDAEL